MKGAAVMLKVFEEHLKQIAVKSKDDFHESIRKRIGKRATSVLEQRLRGLILLTPRLLVRAHQHASSAAIPSEAKRLIGFAMTYFYHPQDFLSEADGKLFSYLDDAYCVAIVYEKILKTLIQAGHQISGFDREFLDRFSLIKRGIRLVMPVEARMIDRMIEGVQIGQEQIFCEAIS